MRELCDLKSIEAMRTYVGPHIRLPPSVSSLFSDHSRVFAARNESPFPTYAATIIWLSIVRKNSSRPLCDHTGYTPPPFEICHLLATPRALAGNARTYTWKVPDSFDE